MQEAIVRQDFNSNVNNPDTQFCYQCREYKLKTGFTNNESCFVCDQCNAQLQQLQKETGITFTEVPGREATLYYISSPITDVYAIKDGIKYHIGGYSPSEKGFNLNHAKSSIFGRKMRFLNTNGGYITFYNHSGKGDPLEFIRWIKEINDNFGAAYGCEISKMKSFYGTAWELSGNLERRSCAFSFRIFSEELVTAIIEAVSDPYYKNIRTEGAV